jgi:hypothetical protein
MTRHADFKARIRERMARTGERYAAARAVLIAKARGGELPDDQHGLQLVEGYRFGGVCPETAAMANVLRAVGANDPATGEPWDEAALFGLSGGIGFMAFVFQYTDMPPMFTTVLRSDSYPSAFVLRGLERTGTRVEVHETGSARQAAARLDATLTEHRPCICTVDVAALGYLGLPEEFTGYGPREVAVAGASAGGDRLALDDRALHPIVVDRPAFDRARAVYRKGRHRLLTVASGNGLDPAETTLEAIRGTVRSFHEPPVKGFASNFGIRGLERWARLVADHRDPKGWPRMLSSGEAFASVLAQLYNGIELEHTPPGGGRPFYAQFLDRAATVTARPALAEVADRYRELGDAWSSLANAALDSGDPKRGALRDEVEARLRLVDELGAAAEGPAREAWDRRLRLQRDFTIADDDRAAILAELGERAAGIARLERETLDVLEAAVR